MGAQSVKIKISLSNGHTANVEVNEPDISTLQDFIARFQSVPSDGFISIGQRVVIAKDKIVTMELVE